jgi:hypothetical protein
LAFQACAFLFVADALVADAATVRGGDDDAIAEVAAERDAVSEPLVAFGGRPLPLRAVDISVAGTAVEARADGGGGGCIGAVYAVATVLDAIIDAAGLRADAVMRVAGVSGTSVIFARLDPRTKRKSPSSS